MWEFLAKLGVWLLTLFLDKKEFNKNIRDKFYRFLDAMQKDQKVSASLRSSFERQKAKFK